MNAPGQRYHPAIVAQAIATLGAMFPGRFWVALGSGEASNEHITGGRWPRKELRDARLRECVDVIRALLAGEEVTHDGLVTVDRARMWTLPEQQPALIAPAVSAETARRGADWADGLITVNQPHDKLREMIGAYRDAGGQGPATSRCTCPGRPTRTRRMEIAYDQWRSNVLPPPALLGARAREELRRGRRARHPGGRARRSSTSRPTSASTPPGSPSTPSWASTRSTCTTSGRSSTAFLDAFGEHVLPQLDVTCPSPRWPSTRPARRRPRPEQEPQPAVPA